MDKEGLRLKILIEISNELVDMNPEYFLDYLEEQIDIEKHGI